jgi:hypothetical protein
LKLIVGFPFYTWGLFTNYVPYISPSKIANLISSDVTYRAPIMMTVGIIAFPVFYGLDIWAMQTAFQNSWLTLAFAVSLPLTGYFVLWYWDKVTRLSHLWQALRLFRQKPTLMESLTTERTKIFNLLEEAKTIYLKREFAQ